MSSLPLDRNNDARPASSLWLIETLVVVGILAFGYLAMSGDTALLSNISATLSIASAP